MKSTLLSIGFAFILALNGCKPSTGPTQPNGNLSFATTNRMYGETANLDSAVKAELGTNYRIADWNDVKSYCAARPVDSIIATVNWVVDSTGTDTTRQTFFVLDNGNAFWPQDPTRHYFTTRFDHEVPSTWLVHDQIDDSELVLGSWYDVKFRVLAVTP